MNMHCHKSSISTPLCSGQLLTYCQNIHFPWWRHPVAGSRESSVSNKVSPENSGNKKLLQAERSFENHRWEKRLLVLPKLEFVPVSELNLQTWFPSWGNYDNRPTVDFLKQNHTILLSFLYRLVGTSLGLGTQQSPCHHSRTQPGQKRFWTKPKSWSIQQTSLKLVQVPKGSLTIWSMASWGEGGYQRLLPGSLNPPEFQPWIPSTKQRRRKHLQKSPKTFSTGRWQDGWMGFLVEFGQARSCDEFCDAG